MTPAALAATHALCFSTPRPWTEAEFADLLDSPHVTLLGDTRAFLLVRTVLDESEILTLATHPEHRRKGLAAALLDAFHAGRTGRVFLEVATNNQAAQALYAQAGYTPQGQRVGYYRTPDGQKINALILAKTLSD